MNSPEITHLSPRKLALAPENPRINKASPEDTASLEASIAAHGLLENLIVREPIDGEKEGVHHVVAGGRRLSAIKKLQRAKKLPSSYKVPCLVVEAADAREIAVAENQIRADMSVADLILAFGQMRNEGRTVLEIAAHFGQPERNVQRLVSLANVHPDILAAYRADKLRLDTLKAFTLGPPEAQKKVYDSLIANNNYHLSSYDVRKALIKDAEQAGRSPMMTYVGIDDYRDAGGTLTADLFADDEDGYISNPEILTELFKDKVKKELKEYEGWAFIDIDDKPAWNYGDDLKRLDIPPAPPTPAEAKSIEEKTAERIELLNMKDVDDAQETKLEHLDQWLNTMENTLRHRAYTPEIAALCGVHAYLRHNGDLVVDFGYYDPKVTEQLNEVLPDAHKIVVVETQAEVVSEEKQKLKDAGVTAKHAETLSFLRTSIIRGNLAWSAGLAIKLLTFHLARQLLPQHYFTSPLRLNATDISNDAPGVHTNEKRAYLDGSPGHELLRMARNDLNLSWLDDGETDDQKEDKDWEKFCQLSQKDQNDILAYCVAVTVPDQLAFESHASEAVESITAAMKPRWKEMKLNPRDYWDRLSKKQMLKIAEDTIGKEFATEIEKLKKDALAKVMERIFGHANDGTAYDLSKEQLKAAYDYVPPGFIPNDMEIDS